MFQRTALRAIQRGLRAERKDGLPTTVKLTLTTPYETIYDKKEVAEVAYMTATGATQVGAQHSLQLAQLKPGFVKVWEQAGGDCRIWFTSGGFAAFDEPSDCAVTTGELIPLDDLDAEKAKAGLDAANSESNTAASAQDKAVAEIKKEVFESMLWCIEQREKA